MRDQILNSYFLPNYQMNAMLNGAKVFNQVLSFDTAKVSDVRVYILVLSPTAKRNQILIS